MMGKPTRGERNNNPGNIRISSAPWTGKVLGTDSEFEFFDTPEYGIRALAKIILNYGSKYELKTVRRIINRWAPPSENNTDAYVEVVCGAMRCDEADMLNLKDDLVLGRLVKAIIRHENGRCIYTDAQIKVGIDMALGKTFV